MGSVDMKIGRNDKCPCGSGRKYKNCCLKKNTEVEKELNNMGELVFSFDEEKIEKGIKRLNELLAVSHISKEQKRGIYRNLLGGLYRENPVKSRNYEAVKSSKKWENVGNSYIIPALLLYRYSYI